MRICHIAATTEGATWMVEQLAGLRDRFGHDVTAIVEAGSGELLRRLEREGIPYLQFDFSFPDFRKAYTLLLRVIELARVLRRERFDVVQTHLFNSMVLGRLAAWLADVPVRLSMIAGPYHLEAPTPRWIDGSTLWMDTALIPSCEYTRDLYRAMGVPDGRLHLVYYGPDGRKFHPEDTPPSNIRRELGWPSGVPLIAMVAYFYPALPASSWTPPALHNRANKRHEDLIAAAPVILREFPDARILLIGSSWGEGGAAVEARLRQLVETAGLQQHIRFLGYRPDVNGILREVNVSVQASVSENLGGTLESLLMGCPVVATRSGGMVDSVQDGVTGVLVEPLNPHALGEGILRMLRDPDQARRYGEAGRTLALQRFSLQRTVADLDAVYRALRARRRLAYLPWITAARTVAAMPVFLHLAARLARDLGQPFCSFHTLRRLPGLARAVAFSAYAHAGYAFRRALPSRRRPSFLSIQVPSPHWRGPAIHAPRPHWRTPSIRLHRSRLPAARLQRMLAWLRLSPWHIYGSVRKLLHGTELLRRWDIFFARIRGRTPA